MTQTLDVLTRRMGTMQSIRGVVRTMKTLSAVNAAPYEAAAASIDSYHTAVLEGLQLLIHATGGPAPRDAPAPRAGIALVFGSDHGLCGGYNETVADAAHARIGAEDWQVFSVGARMEAALDARVHPSARHFQAPASADGIGRLAGEALVALDAAMAADADRAVILIHMAADEDGRAPVIRPLLPLDPDLLRDLAARPWGSRGLPTLTMPAGALFAALIRNHLFASVFRAAAEAMATENAARLALMLQAERAIDERLSELLCAARSARQSEVTNELLDVIAGFEALKTRGCGA
jgi:F-type H+-transporting ATPase subunit gamma